MKRAPRYTTEAALCADFIAWVRTQASWTAYPETAGWDILLVATDGTQIGVQAKLKFNMKVLHQSVPHSWDAWRETGPDFRAVLLPDHDGIVDDICGALGLTTFHPFDDWQKPRAFVPTLNARTWHDDWHYWSPKTRCKLPDFVPDVVAGDSAPVRLTEWKVGALRLVARIELRGYVTREDFKHCAIDPRRWMAASWVVPGAKPGQFVRGEIDFAAQHPEVYPQVLAEVRKTLERVEGLLT